ncbi:MAG TPA: site-specific integrase [Solirubrobacterales bacterium]|jgi:integrase
MAKLTKTSTPGIFRRHTKGCGGGRCDCAYVVVWRHRGKQHKETCRTLAEAREAQGKRRAGDSRPSSRITVEAYFCDWIETYEGRTTRGFSETSRSLYRRAIEDHALPTWRTWKLSEVEPAEVRALYRRLRGGGKSTATLKTLRAALSAMYSTAVEDGVADSNPIRGVRLAGGDTDEDEQKHAKAFSREELRVFFAALPDDGYWRLFFEFLAVTGLRIGEAIGLTWENLDLGDQPKVKVREQVYRGKRKRLKSKDGKRDIPLSASMVVKLLAHRRDSYVSPKAPVFSTTTGSELDPHNVRRTVLRPAAISLGYYELVEGKDGGSRERTTLGFHAFRHTCASLLFAEGRNVKQVQRWLGHAKASITLDTYLHLLDEGVGGPLEIDKGDREAVGGPEIAENGSLTYAVRTAVQSQTAQEPKAQKTSS